MSATEVALLVSLVAVIAGVIGELIGRRSSVNRHDCDVRHRGEEQTITSGLEALNKALDEKVKNLHRRMDDFTRFNESKFEAINLKLDRNNKSG